MKLDAVFVNISFVGSNALAKELGTAGGGVVITQVVPFPGDKSDSAGCRATRGAEGGESERGAGLRLARGLSGRPRSSSPRSRRSRRADPPGSARHHLGGSFDLGGVTLKYGSDDNQGMDEVFLTVIQPDGTFKPITALKQAGG